MMMLTKTHQNLIRIWLVSYQAKYSLKSLLHSYQDHHQCSPSLEVVWIQFHKYATQKNQVLEFPK